MWAWSDLRYFLAVARCGSTSGAARLLGVNQTTCARRIDALERALGLPLFERTTMGYRITEAGASLLTQAERTEQGALAFERLAAEQARGANGVVRLTTGDFLADRIAIPAIAALAKTRPDLRVELDISSGTVDLTGGGAADVALRAALAIDELELVARKILDTPWAFYCSADYARRNGRPGDMSEAMGHPLVMLAGAPTELLRAAHPAADLRHTTNSMAALAAALASGRGVGALPVMVGERHPELEPCFQVPFDTGGVWIVYHERLRKAPHVRALVDHLARFASDAPRPTNGDATSVDGGSWRTRSDSNARPSDS